MRNNVENIVIIGAGNVATHLAKAFLSINKNILQVISKTEKSAKELASKINCPYSTNLEDLKAGADLYLLAVSDPAIEKIAREFPFKNVLIAHTSGSVSMEILKTASTNYGVFYPLQTFTKNISLDYNKIPFCLEANTNDSLNILKHLGSEISDQTYEINFKQRQTLHLAAVFACNFTNHMYSIANEILKKDDLSFKILQPLIEETAKKIKTLFPDEAQTGPAVRNDEQTIAKHVEKLNMFEDYQKIYTFMTESIRKKIKTRIGLKNK
ncbi:MAG: Rossmann-like and DUF2520 domain-containing protein [Bacteroidota bacterium]